MKLPDTFWGFVGIGTGIVVVYIFMQFWGFALALIPTFGWLVPAGLFFLVIWIRDLYNATVADMAEFDRKAAAYRAKKELEEKESKEKIMCRLVIDDR